MNSNVPMKQQTKPGKFAEPHLFSELYRSSNAIPKATITCGQLHPSPPISIHFRYNLSYRGESIPLKTAKNR
jgi:hypothetical protein